MTLYLKFNLFIKILINKDLEDLYDEEVEWDSIRERMRERMRHKNTRGMKEIKYERKRTKSEMREDNYY